VSVADANAALPGVGQGIWNVSVVGMMAALVDAIRSGRAPREAATFADGLKCQQAMDAVRQSHRERRWVALD
jgi:predicted dehydrogenase